MNAPPEQDTEDLFTPTLSEDDDALDFDQPWNPQSLVFATFFGGFLTGGILFGLNFKRLGRPERAWPCIVGGAILTLAWTYFAVDARQRGWYEGDSGLRSAVRIAQRALPVIVALWIAQLQKRRFRVYEGAHGEGARALVPGFLAVLLSMVVTFGLAFSLQLLLGDA